ncbi:MAG TPA: GH1 family beta-glucosidase [Candidatus Binataceae bacterium]|nr:GH1 family beta-glucosidase [Candidatus Binataceae bacterium]
MAHFKFPDGFLWGTASASYQIEGAVKEDGRGESVWDRFSHTAGRIHRNENGDLACDFYHRYRDDIALMSELNHNAARMSLSWSRIIPDGKGHINQKGIDFYSRVIDELLRRDIRPFVTLYHWDLPQTLEDEGGWPNRELAKYFADYASLVGKRFGDRVKDWIVFNEPWIFTILGYLTGIHAPGRMDPAAAFKATHVASIAHGLGVRALRASSRPGAVGTAYSMAPCYPATNSDEDRHATELWHRFFNLWFLEPALNGRYPEIFATDMPREWLDVRPGDLEIAKAPLDFIGINLYSRMMVKHEPHDPVIRARQTHPPDGAECTDFGSEVYPSSLGEMILKIDRAYGHPVIYVTENGCSYGDGPGADGMVHDHRRTRLLRGFLEGVADAMKQGADVRGYFLWSLMDNFEWAYGYSQRFGIVHCDFETQKRIVKDSGHWYSELSRTGILE